MRRPQQLRRPLLIGGIAAVVAVGLVVAVASLRAAGPRPPVTSGMLRVAGDLPNVLLITIDTLRADHVYGAAPESWHLTPALERLATRGTTFGRTMAGAPATLPALAGMMTGSYPRRHRVTSNFGVVPVDVPLLATVLQENGYVTAALYGNNVLKPKSGLGRGFGSYETFADRTRISSDGNGVDRALAWIAASAPSRPWFLWVHLMSPHGPYNSAPRSKIAQGAPDPLPDVELQRSGSNYGLGPMIPKYQLMNVPPRAASYRARYRDEVLFVDAQVGRLLDTLDPATAASTVVVITADHGESLGENDYFFQHGWLPNESSLHVPMIWSQPGRIASGHRVPATTSLVDVMPTLLAGLGLASPPVDGRDLSAGLAGGELADATSFAVTAYPNQVTAAVRGRWKLVHTPPPPDPLPRDHWHEFYPKEESWALHDLRSDPRETTDLSARHPDVLESLRRELHDWEARNGLPSGSRATEEADAETIERLRALGYVN